MSPHREQQRSLQDEAIGVRRDAEPVKKPLERVAHEQQIVRLPGLLRAIEQPLANGVGNVFHAASASIYGRITFSTRQMRA